MSNQARKRARLERELARLSSANAPIQREESEIESKQPRFNQPVSIWNSIFRWVMTAIDTEPDPGRGFRARDEWMRIFIQKEPFLQGIVNSVVDIDKNRGWTIEGGRNQVAKYTEMLHGADEGAGWRKFIEWQAQSYYTARMGFVTELGREGEDGPLRAIWSVDPARCLLTGIPDKPFRYYPLLGGEQEWPASSFCRVASLVSTDETKLGYGFPAAERCLSLAKIMIGVLSQFKQQVLSEAPEGLLTGKNIGQDQWDTALEHYGEALQSYSDKFARLMTLMSDGPDAPEVALTYFRKLPEGFDLTKWTETLIAGYALCFGYDPREFWPVSGGPLGTARETDIQHRKASSKGDLDFSLAFQEQLQKVLPESLSFEFQNRDVDGEKADADLRTSKAQVFTALNQIAVGGQPILTKVQLLEMMAEDGLIPDDYTIFEEPAKSTDTGEELKKELADENMDAREPSPDVQTIVDKPAIQAAMRRFPDEPIYRYDSRKNRMRKLFDPWRLPRSFPVNSEKSEFYAALDAYHAISKPV